MAFDSLTSDLIVRSGHESSWGDDAVRDAVRSVRIRMDGPWRFFRPEEADWVRGTLYSVDCEGDIQRDGQGAPRDLVRVSYDSTTVGTVVEKSTVKPRSSRRTRTLLHDFQMKFDAVLVTSISNMSSVVSLEHCQTCGSGAYNQPVLRCGLCQLRTMQPDNAELQARLNVSSVIPSLSALPSLKTFHRT